MTNGSMRCAKKLFYTGTKMNQLETEMIVQDTEKWDILDNEIKIPKKWARKV